jgi:hypothetical protein
VIAFVLMVHEDDDDNNTRVRSGKIWDIKIGGTLA